MAKLGLDSRRCIFGDHDLKHYSVFLIKEEVLFKTYQLQRGRRALCSLKEENSMCYNS